MKSPSLKTMVHRNPLIYMGIYKGHDLKQSFIQRLFVQ